MGKGRLNLQQENISNWNDAHQRKANLNEFYIEMQCSVD